MIEGSNRFRLSVESTIYWTCLGVLLVLYLVPLWAVKYLPMLDLPIHLELSSIFRSHDDPTTAISRFYEGRGALVPYVTLFALTEGLARFLPLITAMKVVLSLVAVGLVLAVLSLLRGFGRSRWLVFLALPLIYDVNCTYGYISFRLSVALALGAVGLLRWNQDRPRLWRDGLLAVLALLTFFTHAHGFAILVVLWGLAALLCSARLRGFFRALAPLIPALGLSSIWYLSAMLAPGPGGPVRTPTIPLIRLAELIPHRLLNSFAGWQDELVLLGMGLLWLALLLVSPRPPARPGRSRWGILGAFTLEIALGLMICCYFALPNQILTPTQQIYGINYRFLLVIGLLAVAVPRLDLSRWRALAVAPAVLLASFFAVVVLLEYRTFDQRYRVFDRVLAAIPPGQRVLSINYHTWDDRYTLPTLGHFVGYYCALKDGVTSIDHAGTSYQYIPVKMKDERSLPAPTYPGPINLAVFLPRYDYFLVADRPGSKRLPFDLRAMRLLVEAGPWKVYQPLAAAPR